MLSASQMSRAPEQPQGRGKYLAVKYDNDGKNDHFEQKVTEKNFVIVSAGS